MTAGNGKIKAKANALIRKGSVCLTQKPIVGLGTEKFLNSVEVKAEREEDLDIGSLLQNVLVNFLRVLQVRHTNRIASLLIAHGIKRIHNLAMRGIEKIFD